MGAHTRVQLTLGNVRNPEYDTLPGKGEISTWDSSDVATAYAIDSGRLTTSQIFTGETPMMSGADYGAYCSNSCSRHGVCRNFGKCRCYTRQGTDDAAWTQHDCSVRTCPKHTAWVDTPDANNDAHKRVECAGRGTCDRKSGQCQCFPGYTGFSCERQACPNNCSGRGRCMTQNWMAYEASKTYTAPWDASMAQ